MDPGKVKTGGFWEGTEQSVSRSNVGGISVQLFLDGVCTFQDRGMMIRNIGQED